jgi:hypothetical protein
MPLSVTSLRTGVGRKRQGRGVQFAACEHVLLARWSQCGAVRPYPWRDTANAVSRGARLRETWEKDVSESVVG